MFKDFLYIVFSVVLCITLNLRSLSNEPLFFENIYFHHFFIAMPYTGISFVKLKEFFNKYYPKYREKYL